MAVDATNADAVVCVFADAIRYMVVRPLMVGANGLGSPLAKSEATLVGVLVGDSIRPIDPQMQIFFAVPERLTDARRETGA